MRKHGSEGGLLRPWMRLVVHLEDVFHGQLGVALRGREAFMAEKFLNGAQVGALLQHVRAEGVTQRVGMDLFLEARLLGGFMAGVPHGFRIDGLITAVAAVAREQP